MTYLISHVICSNNTSVVTWTVLWVVT